MARQSRYANSSSSIWPGYVDVLSALLMVVIFVLLIFTFSQFLLSYILSDQSSELESLHLQLAEITELLGIEEQKNSELTSNITALNVQIDGLSQRRDSLQEELMVLQTEQDSDRRTMEQQLLTIASLQQDISTLQSLRKKLEQDVADAASSLAVEQELTRALRDRSKALTAELAEEQELTLLAQKDIEQRNIRIEALSALVGVQQESIEKEQQLRADTRAEVALLQEKLITLRDQLTEIKAALSSSEEVREAQQAQIEDLGRRLNIELARRVNELERYKSDFFGRLREVLADNPQIRVEGDRFLLQSELLFESGTANLGEAGKNELIKLAALLTSIIPDIPEDLSWILRVDGHTDKVPINSSLYGSNWELSMARAVSVVRFLATRGIPEERMAAAGFSKFHPLDSSDTEEAYRKNRRIEIKLTSR